MRVSQVIFRECEIWKLTVSDDPSINSVYIRHSESKETIPKI